MKICAQCKGSFEEGIAYCPTDGSRLTTISKMQVAGQDVPAEAVKHAAEIAAAEGIEDLTGRTIAGRYQISRRLGEGGMGIVYRAVDSRLEKEVAIKVLKEDFAHRTDVVARFTQEAKSAARIKHENVLDVTDYGQTEDGSFYIAMELLVGTDLADVLQRSGTLDPLRAVSIMIQVSRALGAAHGRGIVHRDLKPENVFLVQGEDNREVVKIVDFGIAQMKDISGAGGSEGGRKLTRTGMIFGTPEYMSPEQAAGKPIDQRVDIYAVGVILYELLAGRVPFVGDTFMGVLTQHMFENAPPIKSLRPDAQVTPDLESVIAKALAKDPAHRYQSMQEISDDLARVRDGLRPAAAGVAIPSATRPNATGYTIADTPHALAANNTPPVSGVSHTVEFEQPQSRRGLFMLLGFAAIVLAGGGVILATGGFIGHGAAGAASGAHGGSFGPSASGNAPAVHDASVAVHTSAPAGATDAALATGTPDAATAPAEPEVIRVHVESSTVARIDADGTTCDQTPCDLMLRRGREVRLVATAPHKHGELAYTPLHEGESVRIQLATAGGPSHGGGRSQSSSGNTHARGSCRPGQLHLDPSTGLMVPCFLPNEH